MKKILLIGDSIRQGYDKYVKYALRDSYEVCYPKDHCRFAQYVLRHISDWKNYPGDDYALVHWNAGLWDTLVLFEDGCLTPIEFYEYFIDRICNRIKVLFPNAKVIFATSTPIVEGRFTTPEISHRKNSDIEKYNETACNIARKYGFYINDLYAVTKDVDISYYSDMTHLYTPDGAQLHTNAVLKAIGEVLGENFGEFTLTDYEAVREIIGQ